MSTRIAARARRRTVALSSSCTCDACRRTPELDLKFCAHHGEFVEHDVAGSRELVGSDVILAHRLLKNSIADTHGLRGYALLTDVCAQALGARGLYRWSVDRRKATLRYRALVGIGCRRNRPMRWWRCDAPRTVR